MICTSCDGSGSVTCNRKSLTSLRTVTITCYNCYGTGSIMHIITHRELTIIKHDDHSFFIAEMQSEVTSLNQAKAIIDSEYYNYKNHCDPFIDGSFLEYIHEGLRYSFHAF